MNEMTVFLLVAALAALPIVTIALFLLVDWWKNVNKKQLRHKLVDLLLLGGVMMLTLVLLYGVGENLFLPAERILNAPKTTVCGTIEGVNEYSTGGRSENAFSLEVRVDGIWYTMPYSYSWELWEPRPEPYEEFQWLMQAEGKRVELEIYSENVLLRLFTGFHYRGAIYGITDAEGRVILDAEELRMGEYEYVKFLQPLFWCALVLSAGLIVLWRFLTYRLKW